jgi:uncharacterized repeat protein (TIGR03803 family)
MVLALLAFAGGVTASAQHEVMLYAFGGSTKNDGSLPYSGLVADGAGNLYGTTLDGGFETGIVYELSPPVVPGSGWIETVLFRFGVSNGDDPYATLIIDAAGNLYGTTAFGGGSPNCQAGCGLVYELSPPGATGGEWTETVLYSFSGQDGAEPYAGVIFDQAGNLYGATRMGGENGSGVIYELSPPSPPGGPWSEQSLYNFAGQADGGDPLGTLVFDTAGNLYGTTLAGGAYASGTVFQLSPLGGGQYSENVLHSFGDALDGFNAVAGLVRTKSGVLAGTTQEGGAHAVGNAFALTPPVQQGGEWVYTVLHDFGSSKSDGANPVAGLTVGNRVLYGTTLQGGQNDPVGTVYELMPRNGSWVEKILYEFGPNGVAPGSGVLIHDGALFGTTSEGGASNDGAVYELLLPGVPESPQ